MICSRCQEEIHKTPSPRELQVLKLLSMGYTPKAVALEMGITYKTVTMHKYHVMKALSIHSTGQLIAWMMANGHVTTEEVLRGHGRQIKAEKSV